MAINKQVVLDLKDIDFSEIDDHLILIDDSPKLEFLDNKCLLCDNNAEFYCTLHSCHLCQKCRNKEHNPCIKKKGIENLREFKQELQFDVNFMHKEIKRLWLVCQTLGINSFNQWIYEMSEQYENWIDSLREIAERESDNIIDKVLNNTALKKMKSIHSEIQKSSDWSTFSRSDLLYCVKLLIEKLGEIIEVQMAQKKKPKPKANSPNKLMKSFKDGNLPDGAVEVDSLPVVKAEIERMIRQTRYDTVTLPNSSLQYRIAKLENGEVYQGQWTKDGRRHGLGTCIYPDGTLYQGFWNNDQKDGIGKYVTDKYHFEGCFYNNQICDLGLFKFNTPTDTINDDEEYLEQKADFSIQDDIWQTIGYDYMVLQKTLENEIIINVQDDDSKISYTFDGDNEVVRVYMDENNEVIKRDNLVVKKKS